MPRRSFKPCLEILEDRDVPSATLLDGTHLTVDFMPDNTSVFGTTSNFYSSFGTSVNAAETEILRAFQTWADAANINFGLVAGEGARSSTPYADPAQSSVIHVTAAPLASTVGAISTPVGDESSLAGDMLINSNQSFSIAGSSGQFDLYTVALHEVGILLGLPENSNPASVMDSQYQGVRTGLSSNDISAIQALYGVRPADSFEVGAGNNTIQHAFNITQPTINTATLSNAQQTDFYKFKFNPSDGPTTIRLQNQGFSLTETTMTVLNPSGTVIATASTSDPRDNNLSLTLSNFPQASNYVLEIQSAGSGVFQTGAYEFSIVSASVIQSPTPPSKVNTTLNLGLTTSVAAAFTSAGQSDKYTAHTPDQTIIGSSSNMIVTLHSVGDMLTPRVAVYDNHGNLMPSVVLVEDSTMMTIEVTNALPSQNYSVVVTSATGSMGNYELSISFSAGGVTMATTSGTLSAAVPMSTGVLQVTQAQVMHFVLSGQSTDGSTGSSVSLTIINALDQVVETLVVASGTAQSIDVYLPPGTYSVTVDTLSAGTGTISPMEFTLSAYVVSNPIGVAPLNPTSTTNTSSTMTPTNSTTAANTMMSATQSPTNSSTPTSGSTSSPITVNATTMSPTTTTSSTSSSSTSTLPLTFNWQTTPIGGTIIY